METNYHGDEYDLVFKNILQALIKTKSLIFCQCECQISNFRPILKAFGCIYL